VAQWGNGVMEAWTFSNRLQAETMQASKGTLLLGLIYGYGSASNNWCARRRRSLAEGDVRLDGFGDG
jgi:hypothetical protein